MNKMLNSRGKIADLKIHSATNNKDDNDNDDEHHLQAAAIKPKTIRKELNRWSKKTTIHLISNIINSRNILSRFLWILFMLVFSVVLVQEIHQLIDNYFRYETVTKIKLEKVSSAATTVVTIHNTNWLNFKRYYEESISSTRFSDLIRFNSNNSREVLLSAKSDFFANYFVATMQQQEDESRIANSSYENSNTKILSCYFNGVKCRVDEDFEIISSKTRGAFYRYEMNGRNASSSSNNSAHEEFDELELIVFIGFRISETPFTDESVGLSLYINPKKEASLSNERAAISIAPGTSVLITVEQTKEKNLPAPFSSCISDDDDDDFNNDEISFSSLIKQTRNLTDGGHYSQKYCFELCYQKKMIELCGCYDDKLMYYVNYNASLESCERKFDLIFRDDDESNFNESRHYLFGYLSYDDYLFSCPYLMRESFYAGDYVRNCLDYCPNECEYTQYEFTTSESQFPSKSLADVLLKTNEQMQSLLRENKYNLETIRPADAFNLLTESLVSLRVRLVRSNSMLVEQVPLKSFIDLISELGENVGMFFGLSILSAFEIIDLVVKILATFLV